MHRPHVILGVTPVSSGLEISQTEFGGETKFNPSHCARYFPGNKFKSAPRPLVIEQHAVTTKHSIGFAVVTRQLKSRHLANAVWTAGMERSVFILWRFAHLPKHFGRSSEIEPAARSQFPQRSQHVMSAVDVCVHRREAVGKRLGDERLGSEVIALIELDLSYHSEDGWVTFKTRGVKLQSIEQMRDPVETSLRIFECDAPDQPVHLVTVLKQILGQVTAILACDSGDKCFLQDRLLFAT